MGAGKTVSSNGDAIAGPFPAQFGCADSCAASMDVIADGRSPAQAKAARAATVSGYLFRFSLNPGISDHRVVKDGSRGLQSTE